MKKMIILVVAILTATSAFAQSTGNYAKFYQRRLQDHYLEMLEKTLAASTYEEALKIINRYEALMPNHIYDGTARRWLGDDPLYKKDINDCNDLHKEFSGKIYQQKLTYIQMNMTNKRAQASQDVANENAAKEKDVLGIIFDAYIHTVFN
jgi:hypothetical protein